MASFPDEHEGTRTSGTGAPTADTNPQDETVSQNNPRDRRGAQKYAAMSATSETSSTAVRWLHSASLIPSGFGTMVHFS
jgi:erythromycin esterase-like protein